MGEADEVGGQRQRLRRSGQKGAKGQKAKGQKAKAKRQKGKRTNGKREANGQEQMDLWPRQSWDYYYQAKAVMELVYLGR
jgi:hypothetical protein